MRANEQLLLGRGRGRGLRVEGHFTAHGPRVLYDCSYVVRCPSILALRPDGVNLSECARGRAR